MHARVVLGVGNVLFREVSSLLSSGVSSYVTEIEVPL